MFVTTVFKKWREFNAWNWPLDCISIGGCRESGVDVFSLTKLIGLAARVSLANERIECRNTKTFSVLHVIVSALPAYALFAAMSR
jgi:hypothetical protein